MNNLRDVEITNKLFKIGIGKENCIQRVTYKWGEKHYLTYSRWNIFKFKLLTGLLYYIRNVFSVALMYIILWI